MGCLFFKQKAAYEMRISDWSSDVCSSDLTAAYDGLATPVLWADSTNVVRGCNAAFAGWLGSSARRLLDLQLSALDAEDGRLAQVLARLGERNDTVRVRRARLRSPSGSERFADLLLTRERDGLVLEAHPTDEFPGEDPATALPAALSSALRGLAHELRNPPAGLNGGAQLLGRRVEGEQSLELVALIGSEVERLST